MNVFLNFSRQRISFSANIFLAHNVRTPWKIVYNGRLYLVFVICGRHEHEIYRTSDVWYLLDHPVSDCSIHILILHMKNIEQHHKELSQIEPHF